MATDRKSQREKEGGGGKRKKKKMKKKETFHFFDICFFERRGLLLFFFSFSTRRCFFFPSFVSLFPRSLTTSFYLDSNHTRETESVSLSCREKPSNRATAEELLER